MSPFEQGYEDILTKLGMRGDAPKVPPWMSRIKGQAPPKPTRKKKIPSGGTRRGGISKNISQGPVQEPLSIE